MTDSIRELRALIDEIDRVKPQLESTRAHAQDPKSMDYVYVKISEAAKELSDISRRLSKTLTTTRA